MSEETGEVQVENTGTRLLTSNEKDYKSAEGLSSSNEENIIVIEDKKRNATRAGAVFNIANAAMGAGILGLPYAFRNTGMLLGAILLVCLGSTAWFSMHCLALCCEKEKVKSYEELVRKAFGDKAGIAMKLIITLYATGVCVSFLIITGDLFTPVLGNWFDPAVRSGLVKESSYFLLKRVVIQLIILVVVITPLAMVKTLHALRHSSALAVISTTYFCITVFVRGIQAISKPIDVPVDQYVPIEWFHFSTDIFLALPIIAFALGGHLQMVPIYDELKKEYRNAKMMDVVTGTAVFIYISIYLVIASFGYATFHQVTGNILTDYDNNDIAIQIARIAMGVVVVLSYPLLSWPLRQSFISLVFKDRSTKVIHVGVTVGIIVVTFGIAVLVPDLTRVFGITGATGAVSIKFVIPSALYLKMIAQTRRERIPAWTVVIIGIAAGITSLVTTIADWADAGEAAGS